MVATASLVYPRTEPSVLDDMSHFNAGGNSLALYISIPPWSALSQGSHISRPAQGLLPDKECRHAGPDHAATLVMRSFSCSHLTIWATHSSTLCLSVRMWTSGSRGSS